MQGNGKGAHELSLYKSLHELALVVRFGRRLLGFGVARARAKWGDEQVHIWRRSYDVPPPGGESLKDTLARTLPYFVTDILPDVLSGKNVIVAAHGNSLRSICMVLNRLDEEGVIGFEIGTGIPLVYRLNADSSVADYKMLAPE